MKQVFLVLFFLLATSPVQALNLTAAPKSLNVEIAPTPKPKVDGECVISTSGDFLYGNLDNAVKLSTVPSYAVKEYLDKINAKRAEKKLYEIEADQMIVAILTEGSAASVMFKNGCVVPGSVTKQDKESLVKFLKELDAKLLLDIIEKL